MEASFVHYKSSKTEAEEFQWKPAKIAISSHRKMHKSQLLFTYFFLSYDMWFITSTQMYCFLKSGIPNFQKFPCSAPIMGAHPCMFSNNQWQVRNFNSLLNNPVIKKAGWLQHHHSHPCQKLFLFFLFLVHPCDRKNKGGCDQICTKNGDKYTCSCKSGFRLTSDWSCKKG